MRRESGVRWGLFGLELNTRHGLERMIGAATQSTKDRNRLVTSDIHECPELLARR
jgi:hypothetical protein